MKKLIILISLICFSCKEKQISGSCMSIEKKYDSLLTIQKTEDEKIFRKFYNTLRKEKGNQKDSILIKTYENLYGHDSLIDSYIWDRIHSINQNINKATAYKTFKGLYSLKPNHNKKYAQITKIIIDKDSCFLYKYGKLVEKDNFKLINSSNKYIKGKLRLKQFRLLLDGAIESKPVIHLDDNGCMDCEQLQFYKIK